MINFKKPTRTLIVMMSVLVIIAYFFLKGYYKNQNASVDPRIVPARTLYENYNAYTKENKLDSVFWLMDTIEAIYTSVPHYENSYEIGVLYNNRAAAWLTIALYSEYRDSLERDSLVTLANIAINKSISIYQNWDDIYKSLSEEEILAKIKPTFMQGLSANISPDNTSKITANNSNKATQTSNKTTSKINNTTSQIDKNTSQTENNDRHADKDDRHTNKTVPQASKTTDQTNKTDYTNKTDQTNKTDPNTEKFLNNRVNEILNSQIEIQRRLSVSYTNLGIIHRYNVHYDSAVQCYEKALELWDRNLTAKNNMNFLLDRPMEKQNIIQKLFPPERLD